MGYSMGGTIGFCLADTHDALIQSMILVEEPPDVWVMGGDLSREYVKSIFRTAKDTGKNDAILEMWKERADHLPFPQSFKDRLVSAELTHPQALLRIVEMPWPDMTSVLCKMDFPCLVYAGDQDEGFPMIRRSIKKMRNCTFCAKPGLNHIGSFIRSDLLLREVRAFLSTLQPMKNYEE
jgi:pimeloyl-ACP methyl ester carboxylesterase